MSQLLTDLIQLLQPQAVLFGAGIQATGKWAVSFPKRDDLLFCWIEHGEILLIRQKSIPLLLKKGDFLLIRASSRFVLASDKSVSPIDSEFLVASTGDKKFKLGSGGLRTVKLHAGKFIFDTANENFLTSILPQIVHVPGESTTVKQIQVLLGLIESEMSQDRPATEFIRARLIELILIEILRSEPTQITGEFSGMLAGMRDPSISQALLVLHADVSRVWTLAELAKSSGISRSSFAIKFKEVTGKTPMDYLLNWRIALAKRELSKGTKTIAEIAFAIGFQSASAFSSAFSREVGRSPKIFRERTLIKS